MPSGLCALSELSLGTWTLTSQTEKNFVCCETWHVGMHVKPYPEAFTGLTAPHAELATTPLGNCGASWYPALEVLPRAPPITRFGEIVNRSFAGVIGRLAPEMGSSCDCDRMNTPKSTYTLVTPREQWVWAPANCALRPWSGERFCRMLRGRSLVLIGDSTIAQFASTLMSMVARSGADCGPQLRYDHSDLLYDGDLAWTLRAKPDFAARGRSWTAYVNETRPDIVVLGTGAHYHGRNASDQLELYAELLRRVQEDAKQMLSSGSTLVWTTMLPGHDCVMKKGHRMQDPGWSPSMWNTSTVEQRTAWLEWYTQQVARRYNYAQFAKWDQLARSAFLYHDRSHRVRLLDVAALYGRQDAHSPACHDTLHYCQPGALDQLPQWLLHVLAEAPEGA